MLARRLSLFLLSTAAAAQSLASTEQAASFDSPAAQTFRCDVKPLAPALNFGLRFQAGYVLGFPLKQFTGSGHRLSVLLRVTPEGKTPVFLKDSMALPKVPQTRLTGAVTGSILIGEGNYRIAARVEDEQRRVCRVEWGMRARRDRAEQSLTPVMPPGSVMALSSAAVNRTSQRDPDAGGLIVLLNAAPMRMRSNILQSGDIQRLTGSLAALLERVQASRVRLVLFNLDQQKEVLRRDNFEPGDIDSVTQALNELQVGTVDYKVLSDRLGGVRMLAGILRSELRDARSGDSIVVLGPEARSQVRLPEGFLDPLDANSARVVYLHFMGRGFAPPAPGDDLGGRGGRGGRGAGGGGGGGAVGGGGGTGPRAGAPRTTAGEELGRGAVGAPLPPNTIERIVKRLKGSVVAIRTPQDFARAVSRLNRR
jgi:hypothetical protein